jgi:hypothetical protein
MDDHSGWKPDPTGRHQERFFTANGLPTNQVRNNGVETKDEDRAASTSQRDPERIIARRIPTPSSAPVAPQEATPQGDATRILISRHTTPVDAESANNDLTSPVPALPAEPTRLVPTRGWLSWPMAISVVLILLVLACGVLAFQQHNEGDRWKQDYQTEVIKNQKETQKDTALFAALLTSQQNLSIVTNQKNMACLFLESIRPHTSSTAEVCGGG